jgi:hypothetical protein
MLSANFAIKGQKVVVMCAFMRALLERRERRFTIRRLSISQRRSCVEQIIATCNFDLHSNLFPICPRL